MDTSIPGASAPEQALAPVIFRFNTIEVRTVDINGQVWFIAGDIAKALDYADAVQMTRVLDEDEKGLHTMQTLGGDQQVTIISESGLYHALLKSRKPQARPFRRWVTQEVLPAIRRSGSYSNADRGIPNLTQQGRFLLTIFEEGGPQLTPLAKDVCLLSATNKGSMATLMREFIPDEMLADIIRVGIDRLARMAELRPKKEGES